MRRTFALTGLALVGAALAIAAALVRGPSPEPAQAASHREAPLISPDPAADITDFFFFRSYEPGNDDKAVLIMDVMSEEPRSGPNYWNFDPNVTHRFEIDNDRDGHADDVAFEFKFQNELRSFTQAPLKLPFSYLGDLPDGAGGTLVPPISALDGTGSEGIGLRQKYTVRMIKDGLATTIASDKIAVPANVGPKTIDDYALAAQGIYKLGNDVRVFVGQRDDPFYIDLGAVFDTLNLRSGVDMLSGFNVSTIALEVPISMLTMDSLGADDTAQPKLGAYASTSRPKVTVLGGANSAKQVQVQRLANPLINEAVIGTIDKDRWNSLDPSQEGQFLGYYQNLRLATALTLVLGPILGPATPIPGLS